MQCVRNGKFSVLSVNEKDRKNANGCISGSIKSSVAGCYRTREDKGTVEDSIETLRRSN